MEEQTEEEMSVEEQIRLLDRGITALFQILPTLAESYSALMAEVKEHRACLELILERQNPRRTSGRTVH